MDRVLQVTIPKANSMPQTGTSLSINEGQSTVKFPRWKKKKRNCSTLNFWYFNILIHRWANPVHTRPTEMCNFSLGSCLASAEYCRETHRAPATDLLKLTYFQNCLSWTFPISSVRWLSLENPPENEINAPEENMLLAAVHISVVPALRFPPLYRFQEATALPRFYDMLHTL